MLVLATNTKRLAASHRQPTVAVPSKAKPLQSLSSIAELVASSPIQQLLSSSHPIPTPASFAGEGKALEGSGIKPEEAPPKVEKPAKNPWI